MFRWMIDCKAVTRLVSEAMDRPLPFHRRLWTWIHLLMCGRCAEFRNQVRLLRCAASQDPAAGTADPDAPCLSEDARKRLRASIRDHRGH